MTGIPNTEPILLSYAAAKQMLAQGMLRQSELPIGHYLSLLLPTTRWGQPGFAFFASPCIRRLNGPSEQAPPDRWGVFSPSGSVILYARTTAVPLPGPVPDAVRVLVPTPATVQEMQANLARFEALMDTVIPAFLAGQTIASTSRRELLEALERVVPEPLLADYHALSPEFFDWLEGVAHT